MKEQKRVMVIGAHPDDPDVHAGGLAIKFSRAGHIVKFVSMTNGESGHFAEKPEALAARRYYEAQNAAKIAGVSEYQIMSNRDGKLESTLANREELLRIIRRFKPDMVITHRLCDYHADHRNTAQLVMDTAFLLMVPNYCSDTPATEHNPIYCHCHDPFLDPRPFRADAALELDSIIDDKFKMYDCHVSQFYEWLPWIQGFKDFSANGMTWEKKREWLDSRWGVRDKSAADSARDVLKETYGSAGDKIVYAETFELSPYGRKVSADEFREFFKV